nr:sulfatase-like hydrolase/transferase [Lachnospiraceae bacterium]
NYKWVFDPSFFEDYPYVTAYNTKGYFWAAHKEGVSNRNYRNFFCYSLMKVAPLFVQNHLYNGGFYNENMITNDFSDEITNGNGQYIKSVYTAQGIYDEFMWDYSTLLNLETMTDIADDDTNHYFTIDNDTTHDPIMLQEPEYDVKYDVDNTTYEIEHADRFTVDGMTINMDTPEKYIFYQCNMSSILAIGRWLEYLKKEGVYDNTRIIIVSDHGKAFHLNDRYHLDDGTDEFMDIEAYYPLLLIKDFNSKEFSVSEEFMTNADVPTYAMKGLIDNPVNPFTGNPINNEDKYSQPLYILGSPKWVVDENNGTTFLPGLWLSVEKDMRDKNNWTIIKDER